MTRWCDGPRAGLIVLLSLWSTPPCLHTPSSPCPQLHPGQIIDSQQRCRNNSNQLFPWCCAFPSPDLPSFTQLYQASGCCAADPVLASFTPLYSRLPCFVQLYTTRVSFTQLHTALLSFTSFTSQGTPVRTTAPTDQQPQSGQNHNNSHACLTSAHHQTTARATTEGPATAHQSAAMVRSVFRWTETVRTVGWRSNQSFAQFPPTSLSHPLPSHHPPHPLLLRPPHLPHTLAGLELATFSVLG